MTVCGSLKARGHPSLDNRATNNRATDNRSMDRVLNRRATDQATQNRSGLQSGRRDRASRP